MFSVSPCNVKSPPFLYFVNAVYWQINSKINELGYKEISCVWPLTQIAQAFSTEISCMCRPLPSNSLSFFNMKNIIITNLHIFN